MKRTLIALGVVAASAAPVVASAAPTVYGKLDLSVESVQDNTRSNSLWVLNSNNSRFGVKGENELTASLSAVYGIEWGVSGDGNATDLSQRNRFVGLKSQDYGAIKLGKYDSYLKSIWGNADLFWDLSGDNQNVLTGKNRLNNVIGYESPKFAGLQFNTLVQPGEESNSKVNPPAGNGTTHDDHRLANASSTSLTYTSDDNTLFAGIAYDWHVLSNFAAFAPSASTYTPPSSASNTGGLFNTANNASNSSITLPGTTIGSGTAQGSGTTLYTDKTNTLRLVGSYTLKDAGLTVSAGLQRADRATASTINSVAGVKPKEEGGLVSVAWKFAEGWTGKLQYDASKTKLSSANLNDVKLSQITAGADYNFTSSTKVFAFYNYFQGKNANNDRTGTFAGTVGDNIVRKYAVVGIDHKF